ncbi:hypothetical protein FSZ31_10785 [Sphingorhabdus soli]|uniref:Invasion associated locus B family protein n=1 Tax=Flavisphingopyxis soli TaxID=2601267 RepID=A0A5C6U8M7_9SPHN|nr:hypothetical protein [Sphingorhabdus soli]TXC68176.1 hypothetical protein FSZ31_10785 [Sphingorhabdus soli]
MKAYPDAGVTWLLTCFFTGLVLIGMTPAAAAQSIGPFMIDGWKVDYDSDRCFMVRATGDGQQGIEFQLLEDGSDRMLFMRRGWPLRTGSTPAHVTIGGQATTSSANLSQSEGELLVSVPIADSVIEGLANRTVIGLELPELGVAADFDVGTIAEARENMYECAMVLL